MSDTTTNYQCPHCMGPIHFSSELGKLKCDYCGSVFDPSELEGVDREAVGKEGPTEQEARDAANYWGADAEKMRAYSCSSCGAQLICDETTAATSCPYCGNPTIIPGQFHGTLKPDLVIPFKLNKKDAEMALRKHYRKKLLLPKVFADENHIREIKGIYVPFWLFDLEAKGSVTYHGSHTSTHREGNYRITNTRHYSIERSGSMVFQKVPVDGSKKMPDDLMDSIEPYDYQALTAFTTAYLPGYLADKYDVTARDSYSRAMSRSENTTLQSFRNTVDGFNDVRITDKDLNIRQTHMSYALLPVWLLTTRWKDHTYLFAMNGQTGKMVGDLPVDRKKRTLLLWGSFIACLLFLLSGISDQMGRLILSFFREIFS